MKEQLFRRRLNENPKDLLKQNPERFKEEQRIELAKALTPYRSSFDKKENARWNRLVNSIPPEKISEVEEIPS